LGNNQSPTHFQEQLKEATQDLDNIHFTGYITYKEMAHYLQKADIAVLPSIWEEPFGLTMAEAQAAGLPIITTSQGGIPEVVSEQNAILLDVNEHFVDNLAAAILDLYQHPEKRQQMSKASLERAKLFDKETYAKNFFKALEA
jgi:glycosyltransferase involved in cell wall biosynthesis